VAVAVGENGGVAVKLWEIVAVGDILGEGLGVCEGVGVKLGETVKVLVVVSVPSTVGLGVAVATAKGTRGSVY
jgi:hypothetical protein